MPDEAYDAIALTEVAHVIEKGFGDGEDDEDKRLPADEGRAFPEADSKQDSSVEHQERGDGEGSLEVGFGVGDGACPKSFDLANTREQGDQIDRDDRGPGEL